jgi:UDP-N-acetylmuramoylalanine--D-glutamate ligase
MHHYAAAKARIWSNQVAGDWAVVNADDRAVMAEAASIPAGVQRVTYGSSGDWRVSGGMLTGPGGQTVLPVAELSRSLPHDLANALAASAAALAMGGHLDACRTVLANFPGLPHRVELIGESGGVRYYDDSKATTPASVLAALAGLESVVLIAGGRNKALDLGVLAEGAAHVRAVVALGEAADEIEVAFSGRRPVSRASSMEEAVVMAGALAQPGDAVLLSPGCASFDMYRNYAARGEHFAALVREQLEVAR